MVEHLVWDEGVAGSNPATPTRKPLKNQALLSRNRNGPGAPGNLSGNFQLLRPLNRALKGALSSAIARERETTALDSPRIKPTLASLRFLQSEPSPSP